MSRTLSLVVCVGLGCSTSDEVPACINQVPVSAECDAALRFAARDAPGLVPSQEEIDRYFDRWARTIAAEPALGLSHPQTYHNFNRWITLDIATSNPSVIQAWNVRQLQTGVAGIDDAIEQLVHPTVHEHHIDQGDGTTIFTLQLEGVFNEERLQELVLPHACTLNEPLEMPTTDAWWTWEDNTVEALARIEVKLGWGDCLAGCAGFRTLVSFVGPNGAAEVYDAGGDPLPDNIVLQPTTRPLASRPDE